MIASKPRQVHASPLSEIDVATTSDFLRGHNTVGPSRLLTSLSTHSDEMLTVELRKPLGTIWLMEEIPSGYANKWFYRFK